MGTTANKQLLQDIYAQISRGNLQPLLDSMADDIQWTIIGSTAVSGTSRGKQEVIDKLLKPVRARLADGPIVFQPERFIAEGEYVVMQAQRPRHGAERQALQQHLLHRLPHRRRQGEGDGRLRRHRADHLGTRRLRASAGLSKGRYLVQFDDLDAPVLGSTLVGIVGGGRRQHADARTAQPLGVGAMAGDQRLDDGLGPAP